jgi:hypothetical protein
LQGGLSINQIAGKLNKTSMAIYNCLKRENVDYRSLALN